MSEDSSSEYESSFIDDAPVAQPTHNEAFLERLKREEKRERKQLLAKQLIRSSEARKRAAHDYIDKRAALSISSKERRAETTGSKKLKSALSGVLDRSTCSLWEKRGALFDAINNHPATRKGSKKTD